MTKETSIEKSPLCGRGLSPFRKTGSVTFPSIENDIDTEILVIGGGVAGLLCAYRLAQKGLSPVVCEMNGIGGCSTAFAPPYILPYTDVSLSSLARKYGHDEASRTFSELSDTIEDIKEIVSSIGNGCGFKIRDSFLFTKSAGDEDALNEEYRLRKYSGFSCEKLLRSDCEEMFSFRCEGGIYHGNGAAEINIPQFCEDLAGYLSIKGMEIFEHSPITELLRTAGGFSATVGDKKALIRAKTVIDCRGLYQKTGLLKNAVIYSAVSAQKSDFFGWKNRCVLKSFGNSPLIACTTEDDRIYLEGFSNKRILSNISAEFSFSRLQAASDKMFFGIPSKDPEKGSEPEKFYERVYSYSADGLPYMGRVSEEGDMYRIYAAGRNGIVGAILASKLICEAITGNTQAQKRLLEYEPF